MKTCSVPACSAKHYAKGFCQHHWRCSVRLADWTPQRAAEFDALRKRPPVPDWTSNNSAKRNAQRAVRRTENHVAAIARERAARKLRRERLGAEGMRAQNRIWKKLPIPTRPEPAHCECCGKRVKTCLDHCHETGKFRGWLCFRCNTAIGKLGDNLAGLMKAVRYLRRAEVL
jgi:hypothetical protein